MQCVLTVSAGVSERGLVLLKFRSQPRESCLHFFGLRFEVSVLDVGLRERLQTLLHELEPLLRLCDL